MVSGADQRRRLPQAPASSIPCWRCGPHSTATRKAGSPAALDVAFAAAARAVAERRGERASEPPEVTELERLFEELPEYEELVNVAVGETERSVEAAGVRLWDWFGLETPPPTWNEGERSRARLLVACACAPLDEQVVGWLGPRLLKLSADRWAALLTADLRRADEDLWRRVLGRALRVGVAPVRAARAGGGRASWRTCSPGTTRRRRRCERRLARWLADGAADRAAARRGGGGVRGDERTPDRLA